MGGVLIGMTLAFGLSLLEVHAAKPHDVNGQGTPMIVSCNLIAFGWWRMSPNKMLVGRDQLGRPVERYWSVYIPVLIVHPGLAIATIGMGATNLFIGLSRLRNEVGVGAMVGGNSRHRRLGHMMQWTFGGTILTTYAVYAMLFQWFSSI